MNTNFSYIKNNFCSKHIRFYLVDERTNDNLQSSQRDIGGDIVDFERNMYHIFGNKLYQDRLTLHIVEMYIINDALIFHVVIPQSKYSQYYNIYETASIILDRLLYNTITPLVYSGDICRMRVIYNILSDLDISKMFSYLIKYDDLNYCVKLFNSYLKYLKFCTRHNDTSNMIEKFKNMCYNTYQ